MSECFAFYKDNGDGTWSAVIVGNVVNGSGEVLDARIGWQKPALDEWVRDQIGPTKTVWRPQ
jgi:hypothetical protein